MDCSLLDFQSVCLYSAWSRIAKILLAGFRKPAKLTNEWKLEAALPFLENLTLLRVSVSRNESQDVVSICPCQHLPPCILEATFGPTGVDNIVSDLGTVAKGIRRKCLVM